ncbi:MAG: DNA polymerase domain-containing protein [Metallosphaera sp.]
MIGLFVTGRSEGSDIRLWFRTEQGKISRVYQYKPYFYVKSKLGIYKSVFGDPLDKIVVDRPEEVKKLREKYEHFEADIPYVRRFLIDKDITECVDVDTLKKVECNIKPVVAYIDIEVEDTGALPSADNPVNKITVVTIYVGGVYYSYFLSNTRRSKRGLYKIVAKGKEELVDVSVNSYTDEKEMLSDVYAKLSEADVITAWNVDFDMGYLPARMRHLGLKFSREFAYLDMLDGYKEFVKTRSYKLKDVTVEENIEDKSEAIEYLDVKKDINSLVKYNIRDVWRIVKIDEKYGITDYFIALKNLIGVEDFDFQKYTSIVIDTLLLRFAKKEGKVLPSSKDGNDNPIKGAIVLDPPIGRFENVAVFDMSRYYPSIIISFNISPETKIGKINEDVAEFRQDVDGLMPKLAKVLLEEREKYEKMRKNAPDLKIVEQKITALKFIINAVYGYMGHPRARFYDRDCASTITAIAREGIMYVLDKVKDMGYTPLYGDTDSVFIRIPFDKAEKASEELTKSLREYFRTKYKLAKEPIVHLKYEKYISTIYFTGVKKRYVARVVWKKGITVDELDVKGFEAVRTDSAQITQDFEKALFMALLDGKSVKQVYEIKSMFEKKARESDLSYVALVKGITKPINEYKTLPPHVRAAILANKHFNTDYTFGSRVKYVWCKGYENGPVTDVCVVDEKVPRPIVDWSKQIEAVIESPFNNIASNYGQVQW